MNSLLQGIALASAFGLILPPAQAQGKPTALPELHVKITHISESRNSDTSRPPLNRRIASLAGRTIAGVVGESHLSLSLSISGNTLPPGSLVRSVQITGSVDNLDRKLVPIASRPTEISPDLLARGGGFFPGGPLTTTARFGAPDRDADRLKSVEGTLELYVPSEANGAMIRIANIKSHSGRVEHPALTRAGIEFRFLGDKASVDHARALMPQDSGFRPIDTSIGFGVHFRDNSSNLIGYMIQDAQGAPVPVHASAGGGNRSGTLTSHILSSPLTDDMQLVIFLAVSEAIKFVPFQTGGVELP